jgi:hypothetical protein
VVTISIPDENVGYVRAPNVVLSGLIIPQMWNNFNLLIPSLAMTSFSISAGSGRVTADDAGTRTG